VVQDKLRILVVAVVYKLRLDTEDRHQVVDKLRSPVVVADNHMVVVVAAVVVGNLPQE